MQVYSSVRRVEVNSEAHGRRIFIVTARSMIEAMTELRSLMSPWSADPDVTATITKYDSDVFVVVTDRALEGTKEPSP